MQLGNYLNSTASVDNSSIIQKKLEEMRKNNAKLYEDQNFASILGSTQGSTKAAPVAQIGADPIGAAKTSPMFTNFMFSNSNPARVNIFA
jgi:hypothetical protein